MAITIGDAVLWIRGKSDKLGGDLGESEKKVTGWANRIKDQLGESMNFAIGQIMAQGIDQLTNGIERMARETINLGMTYARQVEDMSRLSGASVEDASRIIQISDDMRMSYDGVSNALKAYAKTQSDAGNNAKISIDTLARLSDQYLSLAPGIDRTNFLLDNFGRAGLEMGKLLEQGSQGIREMAEAVDDSLIMTEEGIRATEEYRQVMDNWNDSIDGIKLQFFQALLPVLTDFADLSREKIIPTLKSFVTWFTGMPEPVQYAIIAIIGLVGALAKLVPAFLGIKGVGALLFGSGAAAGEAAAGGGLFAKIAAGALGAAGALKGVLVGALTSVAAALGISVGGLLALIVAFGALIAVIIKWGPDALENFLHISELLVQILVLAFNRIVFEFQKWLSGWIARIRTIPSQLRGYWNEVGKGMVDGIWQGIQDGWNWLVDQIDANLDNLLTWVRDKLGIKSPSLVFAAEIGRPMAQGIGAGFDEAIHREVMATIQTGTMALAGGAARATQISVGHVEYHGRFSQSEMDYFDRRQERIAENTLLAALEVGHI